MTEEKRQEILAFINAEWDNYPNKTEMARDIENGYIFGPLGENEHYNIDSLVELINIVKAEKEPVVSEPISELIIEEVTEEE